MIAAVVITDAAFIVTNDLETMDSIDGRCARVVCVRISIIVVITFIVVVVVAMVMNAVIIRKPTLIHVHKPPTHGNSVVRGPVGACH